jgi:hypothetical protein
LVLFGDNDIVVFLTSSVAAVVANAPVEPQEANAVAAFAVD